MLNQDATRHTIERMRFRKAVIRQALQQLLVT
jgi:hypothetical protein